MRRTNLLYLAVILLLMTSCVYSLFPIYTKETLVYDPDLIGKWMNTDGSTIEFTRPGQIDLNTSITSGEDEFYIDNGDTIRDPELVKTYFENELKKNAESHTPDRLKEDGYQATLIDGEDTIFYEAKLAKIGKNIFMDFYPQESLIYQQVAGNYFPVHTFMKIEIASDKIVITNFAMKELADLFESNKIRLRHELVDGNVVITAQPKEIQKFLLHYSEDEKVFGEPATFTRVSS